MAQTTPNHTQTVSGWAAHDSSGKITPYVFKRRENGKNDVTIRILYCGICHTDLHHVRNDWGITMYPVVPGHEITGLITRVGSNVRRFKVGDRVGVGCLAASCLNCEFCKDSQENYCDQVQFTYNGIFWDGSITYGGYSEMLIADQRYVVLVPESLPMDVAAPLLCAGVTVFCPMKDNDLVNSPAKRVGIVGLGGLGHVAIKFAKAFGHHVTVISTSPSKEKEAKENLGADDFVISTNDEQMKSRKRSVDFILDTVSADHSLGPILELLKVNGTLVVVGAPEKPIGLPSFPLIFGKRVVKGSMIGGMKETQEMMDLCGKHKLHATLRLSNQTSVPTLKIMNSEDMDALNMTQQQKDALEIRSYLHDRVLMQYGDKLEASYKCLPELLGLSTSDLSSQLGMKRGHIARFMDRTSSCATDPMPTPYPVPFSTSSVPSGSFSPEN